jgi:hypothetical protein
MQTDFRNRVFLPVMVPVLILLVMAAFIGTLALIFLFGTHEMSLMLAIVAAGGILFTVALATSQDRLDPGRRAVLGVAVLTPFVLGALFASGLVGGIGEGERMIDVEPPVEAPEDAVLAAENSDEFCLPADGDCEPTELWTVATQGEEQFVYLFDNQEAGVPHNLSINELEGDRDDPQPGEQLHEGEVITGIDEVTEIAVPGLEPGDYYFVCDVHPATMIGVLEVTEADEDGDAEA